MTGGHGHVVPRKDGARARCGGPGICSVCNEEFARLHAGTVSPPSDEVMDATIALEIASKPIGFVQGSFVGSAAPVFGGPKERLY